MRLKWLLVYPIAVLLASAFLLIDAWPWHPHSGRGWLIFIAMSVPICVILGYAELLLDRDPIAAKVEAATKDKPISSFRITYYLLQYVFICAAVVGVIILIVKLVEHLHSL